MRPIQRAAVTGLFALWLAPLPALPGSQTANAASNHAGAANVAADDRDGQHEWVRVGR
jgi:hypothetical protein